MNCHYRNITRTNTWFNLEVINSKPKKGEGGKKEEEKVKETGEKKEK